MPTLWISWIMQCFCSVTQQCPTLCDPMDCNTPGFPILHYLPEFAQIHVHWVDDATQPSHPLSSPSSPAFNLCQHQGLFKWVSSLHLVAKVLEFQLQHQSFQWIFRTDFLYIDNKKTQTLQRRKDSQKLWKVDFRRGSQCLTVLVI